MSLSNVTVLLANYNDEEYIGAAIQSCLDQDYPGQITICIIDDGSEDKSWNVISSFFKEPFETQTSAGIVLEDRASCGRFGRTSLIAISSTNHGPSEARNIGINYTIDRTDAFIVLDSDDEMYENKISSLVSVFEKGDGMIGVVYGDYDVLHTSSGKIIREYKEPYSRRRLVQECIVHSGSLISKKALVDVVEQTGYYDRGMRTCEDYDLWMRISEKYIIAHVPKSLTKVRVTGDNSSFIVNNEIWQKNWIRVMEKMQTRLNG